MSDMMLTLGFLENELTVVWPDGRHRCCARDGSHHTLPGRSRPVSVGRVEARFLYNLAVIARVRRAFEIGTAFGYSSFWLGMAIKRNDPCGWLGSIDNYSEGDVSQEALRFARAGVRRLGLESIVHYTIGESPEDVPGVIEHPIDLAFVDGSHKHQQPAADYAGLRRYFSDDAFLIWHDLEPQYDVADGVAAAMKDGWLPVALPTSCRLCVCYRKPAQWHMVVRAYESAEHLALVDPEGVIL